jgi:hypothetical protein
MTDFKTSGPACPSALSFLTLPAEIRNSIYELLYVHVDPMVVASTELAGDTATLHRRYSDQNDGLILVTAQENAKYHRMRHLHLAMPFLSLNTY